ncbi:hypothetical protein P4U62_27010 [Bacillus salipaludis]|nr:hypothetical protein [Bacillus salipaludis]
MYYYERRDTEGNLRDLHLEKAIEVTTVPHQDMVTTPKVEEKDQAAITTFVESEFFSVYKWAINGKSTFSFDEQYLLVSVIEGEGTLNMMESSILCRKGLISLYQLGLENLN